MTGLILQAALLLATPVVAQTVPSIGVPEAFDVATWNVERFGTTGGPSNEQLQLENVAAVIRQANIDLWALQEMNDEDHFNDLVAELGAGFDGHWAGYGYIWDTAIVEPFQISTILNSSGYEFAWRPPLQMRANVVLPDTTVEIRLINIHMKCCSDEESYDRRVAASGILKNYTDNLQTIGTDVLVLGDFNDELILSIYQNRTTPYANYLADEAYNFITEGFDLPGSVNDTDTFCFNSSCTSGSVLDHMVATTTLGNDYITDSADHFFDLIAAIPSYTSTTSDHLPVYARFEFQPEPTATEPEVPTSSFTLDAAYPNPFTAVATISYTLNRPGPVSLEVFDVLGRRVAVVSRNYQAPGTHRVLVDGSSLAPGIYVARLTADGQTVTLRMVRGR